MVGCAGNQATNDTGGKKPSPTLVSIAVKPATASISLGSTQQFTAVGTYSDQSTADLTNQASWDLTNSTAASIGAAGLASSTQAGFTKVTATINGVSGTGNLAILATPRYLYDLSDSGRDVSRLTINVSTGQPRYLGYQNTEANNNIGFGCLTIDPSQRYAYVSTQILDTSSGGYAGQISTYLIDPTTGELALLPGSPYTLSEAIGCIQFIPGGNFAYATPGVEEATNDLVVLAKDSMGKLSVINSIALPSFPAGLAIDPRGQYLYVASEAVTAGGSAYAYGYSIDSTTGSLTPLDGMPLQLPTNTYGLFSFNPSGDFLYLADTSGKTITGFSVNRSSGALTQLAAATPCVNPTALQFSPDGKYAFTSCTTGGLTSYLAGSDGQLTEIGTALSKPLPGEITVDPSGKFLYLISNYTYLSTYKIGDDGSLSLLSHTAGRYDQASIALLSGTAPVSYATQSAYISSSGDGHIASYSVNSDGTLTPVQSTSTLTGPFALSTLPWKQDFLLASSGPSPNVQAYTATSSTGVFSPGVNFGIASTAGGLVMDPSGLNAFESDSSTGLVYWYRGSAPGFWATVYAVPSNQPETFSAEAGAGPLAMDPSGRYLFVANQTANSISEFQYAGAAPVPAFPLPASPLALCTGPTGNYVFVAGSDNQLRMLALDNQGNLTDSFDVGLPATPTSVAVEPTGRYVYVTSASGITAFTIDQQAGTLTAFPLSVSVSLANATGVYIDPSGKYLYVAVASSMDNALYLFTINADGTLASAVTAPVATPDLATSMAFHAHIQ